MSSRAFPERPILVVDDDVAEMDSLAAVLQSGGMGNVITCADSREAMGHVRRADPSVVLLDLAMPHLPGEKLLEQVHHGFPHIPVIVVTGRNEVNAAVSCMKAGAFDYMVKAVEESRLVSGVRRAVELRSLRGEYRELERKMLSPGPSSPDAFSAIVTRNRVMQSLFLLVESVAKTAEPVLIVGETGVGKRHVAQAVHAASGRHGPFLDVNAAGLDDAMFSDTLFGRRKGAFTGAEETRGGLLRQAAGGTLLLDEVGDLSAQSQIKLLRLLDTGEYYPLGADLPVRADVRILAATNRDLAALMAEEKFRRDLFYRLSTHELRIPPLRERKDDIPLLVDHFLEEASAQTGRETPVVPAELLALLAEHDFPGNIRELRSMVIDAASREKTSTLSLEPFRAIIGRDPPGTRDRLPGGLFARASTLPTIRQATQMLVEEAMKRAGGNQSAAARLLGISHQAMSMRLQREDW
jgi:two-component system, NtrC family, nitrogen regulation response regulator GlnG